MDFWNDLASIIESLATALALVVAGIWTYLTFVRQRLGLPRLNVVISTQVLPVAEKRLLRTQVTLQNQGSVVVVSHHADLRLRQVVPMPPGVSELVEAGYDPVPDECAQIEWPLLAGRHWRWEKGEFEIEPGETDSLCADFFISDKPQVVEFYFYLSNAKKRRRNIGWTASTILDLSTKEESMTEKASSESKGKGVNTSRPSTSDFRVKQQRPQEPQTQQQPRQPQQQQQTKIKGK